MLYAGLLHFAVPFRFLSWRFGADDGDRNNPVSPEPRPTGRDILLNRCSLQLHPSSALWRTLTYSPQQNLLDYGTLLTATKIVDRGPRHIAAVSLEQDGEDERGEGRSVNEARMNCCRNDAQDRPTRRTARTGLRLRGKPEEGGGEAVSRRLSR